MLVNLVMTVIGPDRPGLVQLVAVTLAGHGGNWLESRLSHLGGQFAGLIRAEVAEEQAAGLVAALQGLEAQGLRTVVHQEPAGTADKETTTATISLVGNDRPGILRAVTAALAAQGINVEELASERVNAPMGGGTLFQATIRVSATGTAALERARAGLEKIAADLMVDVSLQVQSGT